MKITMRIESDDVTTEMSREFNFELAETRTSDNRVAGVLEHPELAHAVQATAEATLRAHILK